jgi:pyrroline-5-carboxylate reductase
MRSEPTLGIIGGAGWLGRAIAGSVLKAGFIASDALVLSSRTPPASGFPDWPDVRFAADNQALVDCSDAIILSVRPEQFPGVQIDARGKLVISVMAGVSMRRLRERTGAESLVRAMPNAAAEIGLSCTPWLAAEAVSADERRFVQSLFETCGTADEVGREADIDYLTGLTGSGPAFPALLARAMLSHALSKGLPPEVARRAVEGVVAGASRLMSAPGGEPEQVVQTFLDYQGTTSAGLRAMIAGGFEAAVHAGLDAAESAALAIASSPRPSA